MWRFDHERLDVYHLALEFVADSLHLAQGLPRGRSILGDQLRRAAISICLNIAEGSGEFTANEKSRFYRIAKRSAVECAAILDLVVLWMLGHEEEALFRERAQQGKEKLDRVVAMLVRMIHRMESEN